MFQRFLKAHWLGLLGLGGLAFFMCCDVTFSSETTKVDAEGPYVMTRMYGTDGGDLVFSVVGKKWDQEVKWVFHGLKLGSLWFERKSDIGVWNARLPLWMLAVVTLGGMAVAAAWPPPRPKVSGEPAAAEKPSTAGAAAGEKKGDGELSAKETKTE